MSEDQKIHHIEEYIDYRDKDLERLRKQLENPDITKRQETGVKWEIENHEKLIKRAMKKLKNYDNKQLQKKDLKQ